MNKHSKLFVRAYVVFAALAISFCMLAIGYVVGISEVKKGSVMLIESKSIVNEQELYENRIKIAELTEKANNLEQENEQLKKSSAFVLTNGNYSLR